MYERVYIDDMNFPWLRPVPTTEKEEVDITQPGNYLIQCLSLQSFMKHGDFQSLLFFPALYVSNSGNVIIVRSKITGLVCQLNK